MSGSAFVLAALASAAAIPGQTPLPSQAPANAAPPATGLTTIPVGPPNLAPEQTVKANRVPTGHSSAADAKRSPVKSPTLQQVDPQLASRPVRLSDAVEVALAVNPQLAQAGQNVQFYRGRVLEARDAFIPTVGISPGETLIHHIWDESYGLQATVPLDISNLLATATRQAQFQEVQARLDVNRLRNEVVYSVARTFFDVLRAQALVKVSETDLQDSLDRLQDAKVRYHAQAVAYIDVLRAQTDVANAQRKLISSQADVSRSRAGLSNAMGIDVNSQFSVTDAGSLENPPGVPGPTQAPEQPSLTGQDESQLVPAPAPGSVRIDQGAGSAAAEASSFAADSTLGPDYWVTLGEALRTRPEIWQSDAAIAAAKQGVTLARRSVLPGFQIQVGYYDERSVTGVRYDEPQAFLGLSIPLFDGGLARDRVREARSLVEQQVSSRRQAVDAVTLDVQNAYYGLIQSRAQVAVANQALAQAEAAFQLARIRYNTGVSSRPGISPIIEVSDAQAALSLASQNQVNALYDYNVAKAQLDRGVGRFSFALQDKSGFSGPPAPPLVGLKSAAP